MEVFELFTEPDDCEFDSKVMSELFKHRTLFLTGEVDEIIGRKIVSQLLLLDMANHKEITLYLNTPGGEISHGLAMYDMMHHVTSDVRVICFGEASSMGAILLAGGTKGKREAFPSARIMIHQPLGGARGQASDIEIQAREILKLKSELNGILAKHTGKSLKVIEKAVDRDNFMSAEEALKFGIIDKILERKD